MNCSESSARPSNQFGETANSNYDTSFRVGVKLNLFPTKVYLHAGRVSGCEPLDWMTAGCLPQLGETITTSICPWRFAKNVLHLMRLQRLEIPLAAQIL